MSRNTSLSELINYVSASSSGNVTVAPPASGFALEVFGTGRYSGALSGSSATFSDTITINKTGASTLTLGQGTSTNDYGRINFYGKGTGSGVSLLYMPVYNTQSGTGVLVGELEMAHEGSSADNRSYFSLKVHNGTSLINPLYISATGAATFSSSVATAQLYTYSTSTTTSAIFETNAANSYIGLKSTSGTNYIGNVAYAMTFEVGGSERMRITSSGNVGIGTSSPASFQNYRYLQITGGNDNQGGVVRLTTSAGTYNAELYTEFSGTYLTSSGLLGFYTAGSEKMRITTEGNVEIGSTGFTSPSGADRFIGVYGGQDCSLILQDAVQLWELYVNDDFYINRGSTNVLTALRSNGNVGIGTASPSQLLTLGGAATVQMTLRSSTTTGGSEIYFGDSDAVYRGFIGYQHDGDYMQFSTAGAERMRITSAGKLAIGMTNADYGVVSIKSNSSTSYYGLNVYANSNDRFIALNHTGTDGVIETENAGSGVMTDMIFKTNASERMRIYSDGRIRTTVNGVNGQFQIHQTNSGYNTDAMMYLMNNRNATSSYNFAKFFSGYPDNTQDVEFNFRGDGTGYSDGGWTTPASDYAEYFESTDGTALQIGATVVLENGKVKISTEPSTDIIGVIRPKNAALFLGNNQEFKWNQKHLKDDFGAYILDDEGMRILNPQYDPNLEYISRENRDEWNIVGLVGQVPILKTQPKHPSWIKMYDVSDNVEMWLIK